MYVQKIDSMMAFFEFMETENLGWCKIRTKISEAAAYTVFTNLEEFDILSDFWDIAFEMCDGKICPQLKINDD